MDTSPAAAARAALVAALAALLALAGCTSGDDAGSGRTGPNGGRSDGTEAAPPGDEPVRVVTFNLLHGLFCPEQTDACGAPQRVRIFAEHLEAAGCPDLVGLQEIGARLEQVLPPALERVCEGEYQIAWQGVEGSPDRSMVLTRLPVLDQGPLDIANFPWEAYWVRVDSAQGPVDFLTAHFASSVNDPPCAPDRCPPICDTGISTNHCHALEVADFLDHRPAGARLSIVSGDLNATPTSPTIATLERAGFADAWLAAGNAECDPADHSGCTGGGDQPEPYVGMDTPEGPGFDERIDYVLARPGGRCALQAEARAFAAAPRAEALDGLWWPSDHAGVLAELRCE